MTPDNLRYGQKGAGSEQQGSKLPLGLLLEQLRSSLGAGKEQLRSSLRACKVITSQGVCPLVSPADAGAER